MRRARQLRGGRTPAIREGGAASTRNCSIRDRRRHKRISNRCPPETDPMLPAHAIMNAPSDPLNGVQVYRVRQESVVLDHDLAGLYGATTKSFNQAIRRNTQRFPRDFAYQLTAKEWSALRSQIVTLKPRSRGQHRKYLPWVFTEHGAIMAATLLNSARAVAMSTHVVRAFVRLRRELLTNATLEVRLTRIENELLAHDAALRNLYAKIKPLLLPPAEPPAKEMGFHTLIPKSPGTHKRASPKRPRKS